MIVVACGSGEVDEGGLGDLGERVVWGINDEGIAVGMKRREGVQIDEENEGERSPTDSGEMEGPHEREDLHRERGQYIAGFIATVPSAYPLFHRWKIRPCCFSD